MGNLLIYTDTWDQALAQLTSFMQGSAPSAAAPSAGAAAAAAPPARSQIIESIRDHLRRYRDFAAQGRWSEAGKELEAIQSEVK
jgi:acyl-CoA reductase-like NAD-dependent aldehyde dehydrogenase